MGRCSRHFGRDIDGIILLDKPLGLSSNDLLQKVKKLFCANKAGHTGALDPLATGMLPICFGEATKFSQHLLNADKRYRVIARLGERTNTADAYGEIVSIRPVVLDEIRLAETLNTFRGITLQVPSMFSALKHQGRSLYEYARQGINVVRKARPIQIYNLQLLHWESTKVDLEIHCSKGTYIRTLIDDLGERLGCGAHVQLLRRLTVGSYPSTCMVTLNSLQTIAVDTPETFIQLDKMLLPIDSALKDMPIVNLPLEIATRVQFGQAVVFSELPKNGFVRLSEKETGRFFGIGEITALKRLMPRRLITKPRP